MEKVCTQCGESKPADSTHYPQVKSTTSPTGLRCSSWCRACVAGKTQAYNAKHPEERRTRDQAYRERTIDSRREYERLRGREYNQREAVKESRRKHHQMIKRKCLAAYSTGVGLACVCCGEDMLEFLTLDHAMNDGKAHRTSLGGKCNGPRFYKWLADHGYPQHLGLRVLCLNCNWARHWSPDKRCPHEIARHKLTLVTPAYQAA
jgi:hypothetical protein